ncbi:MAG: alanine dehydrogenase [Deltaproteobacteria bacterium]|nr:alanine dehydrogenase [Deltaproteobacteria bacterium]
MIIGVPKEIKEDEYRVGIVPSGVRILAAHGHSLLVESGAGEGSRITDAEYVEAGATIVNQASEVYGRAEMIMKVKEPQPQEYKLLREGQILYAYLHLAPAPELTRALLDGKIIAVAYETIQLPDGTLPLLVPMSEVAGRMSVQIGAHFLEKTQGGRGVLLGGVPGVGRGRVTVVGAGSVGRAATKIAVGLGAEVHLIDLDVKRLMYMDDIFGSRVTTIMSNYDNIYESVVNSHLVIGAVLIPGARAPRLISRDMVRDMKGGAVIVDVAVDQGGCAETTSPTTHSKPTFVVDEVIHYCVPNMPGAVARTSTFALTNVTLPYALKLAERGFAFAVRADAALAKGVNLYKGHVTYENVALALGLTYVSLDQCGFGFS